SEPQSFGEILADYWWIGLLALVCLCAFSSVIRYALLIRLPLWILTHTFYRVRAHGLDNIPETGPALLVANHVSYIDPLLILAGQKRKIRFFMWAPYTRLWGLG